MSHIINAREYAKQAHRDQKRKWTGEPYFVHPERVAIAVLSREDSDEDMVAAAYMHDVPEDIWAPDCKTNQDWDLRWIDFEQLFNNNIARLVRGLTNYSKQIDSKEHRAVRKKLDRDYLKYQNKVVHILKLEDRYDNVLDMVSYPQNIESSFMKLYEKETSDLLEVIGYADTDLRDMIKDLFRFHTINNLK